MSDYKNLRGKKVKFFTSDLSTEDSEGQIFYSDTDKEYKVGVLGAAWSSGSALATARYSVGGHGTQTAGLISGGNVGPSDTKTTLCEEWNVSGFLAGGALPTANHSHAAIGTQTAGLISGGYTATAIVAETFHYDGSSWTAGGDINTARSGIQNGSGTQTAGLHSGGRLDAPDANASTGVTEEYDGSSWTESGDIPADTGEGATVGTQTATLLAGGVRDPSAKTNTSFEYNGTTWTAGENMSNVRRMGQMAGIQTAAIITGGESATAVLTATEDYDGTNFSASPASLTLSRYGGGPTSSGSNSAYMVAGGYTGTAITNTSEVFNKTAMTVTAAAWSSGGALPSGAQELFGSGIQTAALCGGGEGVTANPPNAAEDNVFEYDGSSWTAGGSIPVRSNKCSGCGTQTATIIGGKGTDPYSGASGATRSYDGSSWTAEPSLGTARYNTGLAGTTTAAVAAYGRFPPSPFTNSVTTEEWDGSSWTAGNNANNSSTISESAGGSQTAAIYASLNPGAKSETYDGTNWTNISPTVGNNGMTGSGTQTDFIIADGNGAFRYNGTVWATSPDISTARGSAANSNVAATALISGGGDKSTATEEFTDESTSLNLKTITDS